LVLTGTTDAETRATRAFTERWETPTVVARAPGRVNLIGDHTDYNDGFVLPVALPFDTVIVGALAPVGSGVELVSEGFGTISIDLSEPAATDRDWGIHLRGVHQLLGQLNVPLPDWRGTISTDIPAGASLSSSAALEVACISLLLHFAGVSWSGADIALLGQRVENEVLGLPSGIMDQLISATATDGHASLIDCRSLIAKHYRLPPDVRIVVMDSGTRRELVDSEYAQRQSSCEEAARHLGLTSLRDASLDDLDRLAGNELLRSRARHVVTENQRTLDAAKAMTAGDNTRLGELMTKSHNSLRDDFEVSGPGLDAIVDAAMAAPGCLGARMTGGGFAGCAVALVRVSDVEPFVGTVARTYKAKTGDTATLWPVAPGPGACVRPF
jgi:galactokinase